MYILNRKSRIQYRHVLNYSVSTSIKMIGVTFSRPYDAFNSD